MNGLIEFCVKHPVGVSVGVLLLTLFGLLAFFGIPVQLTPTVDTPIINVNTVWPGANPQEVEREIVDRQEEQLRSVKGLRKMTSAARENGCTVSLELYPLADRTEAARDVNDKLRQVTGYPLEVEEPTIDIGDVQFSTIIAWLILRPPEDSQEIRKLRDFAEDYIEPYFERIKGVQSTEVYGGFEREVQVRIDAGQLAARGLTFAQVESALRRQNQNISAGTRAQGKRDYAIRTVGQYESTDEILRTIIADTPGGPVYIGDVGEAELTYKRAEGLVRSLGQYVLAIPVRRQTGANVVEVMEHVRAAVERVNAEVLQARKMELNLVQVYDETVYIDQSIAMVRDNIIYGSSLVLGLLLAFLRSWRATAVLALTIPVSIIGTFLFVVMLGRSLNVISLAGLAFAVGDVVDSAYVVLENIFRHKQMGKPIYAAVIDGTREVWAPVLASTLTTMAVFVPVVFMQEEAGQLFRDISIAEIGAVGLSMIVALTVIPPIAARLLKHDHGTPRFVSDEARAGGRARQAVKTDIVLWLAGVFASCVDWLNQRRSLRGGVIATMTLGSLLAARYLIPDTTYLPAGNRNLVFGFLLNPPGYSMGEFERMARVIEQEIGDYWRVKEGSPEHAALDAKWRRKVEAMIARGEIPELNNPGMSALERSRARREWLTPPPLISNFFFVTWQNNCFMGAISRDPGRVKPLVRLLSGAGEEIPGTYAFFQQSSLFTFGSGNNAEIQIRGHDLDVVVGAAGAMQGALMPVFGYARSDPSNYNLGRPELRIVPDRERAAELGMTAAEIGRIVEACGDGAYVGDYRVAGGDTVDLTLMVKGQRDRTTQEMAQVPIAAPGGQVVPLASLARLIDTTSLEQINHTERQRSVTLTVNTPETMALEGVQRKIREIEQQLRDSGAIDPSLTVSLIGNADKLDDARNALIGEWQGWTWQTLMNIAAGKFLLSVLIVYLLMCALYESWLYPFVIMFSVPLAIFGGFLGLSACHMGTLMTTHQPVQQLDVLTFLGFVMLIGLVVKNAILLVEQSLVHFREYNMPVREAIREAVRVRVRPVFMTSLTSIVGLLPLALMPGAGSELYRGLASVILGGMFVSTLGTLILVPTVLAAVMELREGRASLASAAVVAAQQPALDK